jgi:hypothetical protein
MCFFSLNNYIIYIDYDERVLDVHQLSFFNNKIKKELDNIRFDSREQNKYCFKLIYYIKSLYITSFEN